MESDEDVLLYETGHIPGAVKIDWHTDLNDPVLRDYVHGEHFAALLGSKGIGRDTTVVIYGDKNNWWAAYALWVFTLFGHDDVPAARRRTRQVDRGRPRHDDRCAAPSPRRVPGRRARRHGMRAFKDDVLAHFGQPADRRALPGGVQRRAHRRSPDYPQESALRAGHIPVAQSVPWARAAAPDGTFRAVPELEALYRTEAGLNDG